MRKLIAVGLAGALATASVAAAVPEAQASSAGSFVAGVVVGAVGLSLLQRYHPFATYGYAGYPASGSPHVSWCETHYRSYNAATNTYRGYDGYNHACVAPY